MLSIVNRRIVTGDGFPVRWEMELFDAVGAGSIEYSFQMFIGKEIDSMVAIGKSMVRKSLWRLDRFDIWSQEKKSAKPKYGDRSFWKANFI